MSNKINTLRKTFNSRVTGNFKCLLQGDPASPEEGLHCQAKYSDHARGYPSVFDCSSPVTVLPTDSSHRTDSELQFLRILLRTEVGPNPVFLCTQTLTSLTKHAKFRLISARVLVTKDRRTKSVKRKAAP